MRILIMSTEFPPKMGGIGTYAYEMAMASSQLGHEVTLLSGDFGIDNSDHDRGLPFEVIRYPGALHNMSELPAKISLVRKLARTRDFDIVHAADWPFYIPLALSGYRSRAQCYVTFHGTEIGFMSHPLRAWPLRACRFWNGWTKYICNSRFTAELLKQKFPVAPSAVYPIPLGVSSAWLGQSFDRDVSRQSVGIEDGKFVIASLGRVVRRKGHLVLADALKRLPADITANLEWRIIGPLLDPAYEAELRASLKDAQFDSRILGQLKDGEVKQQLAAADLFCLPGFFTADGAVEGFGLVYLEAGALGLTSVATNTGGVPDAIEHGQTGILVGENDVAGIADAIEDLYRNPGERQRLAANARRLAERSTWTHVAQQTYGF